MKRLILTIVSFFPLIVFILIFFTLSVEIVFAENTVSVDVTFVYKITGETVNGIPRYIADIERSGNTPQGENRNLTIYNQNFPYYSMDRWFYWWNSTNDLSNGQLAKEANVQLVEQGPVRVYIHSENTSSSYGNVAQCWTDACWNISVDVYAYPRYYFQNNKIWGNYSKFQMTVGGAAYHTPYRFAKISGAPPFGAAAWYFVNGTYQIANNTWGETKKPGDYTKRILFLFNETGHNKTYAVFSIYSELTNNPTSTWDVNNNPVYYFTNPGLTGGNNPSPYIFGYGYLFSDSGAKSLIENETVWQGFKDQWFDIYYPVSITPITGNYQGRDNITGTYNFTASSDGLLRFNLSTNIKHYLPVFHIKDTTSISNYKDHIWYKNYSSPNPTWIKLNNFTDFIIQEGNSTYFGYDYILLLINKTLGSDYEFWIDDDTDPPPVLGPTFGQGTALNFYTGEEIDGNITVIPVENPENKTNNNFTNGEWWINFDMITEDVEYLTFIINDNEKIGYTQLKLDNRNPRKISTCSVQNISLSGYAVDVNTGKQISSGNVRVSVVDSDYTNITSFSGVWSIDFHPCLMSGKIYTLHILISDNSGKIGEMFYNYPAR